MIRYLLDANVLIAILNDKNSRPAIQIRRLKPDEVGVSSIVVQELFYGAFKSQKSKENVSLIDSLQLEVVEFDKEDAREAGEIRADLARKGTPIGPYDVLIAGHARARGLILVTNNVAEFGRVVGLKVEDWQN